jgi:hypothetical protein
MATQSTSRNRENGRLAFIVDVIQQIRSPEKMAVWFILSAGGILMLTGVVKVIGFFGHSPVLDFSDPILGIQSRFLILIVGIVELVIVYLCLFTNMRSMGLGLVAWMAANFLVYRVGLWYLGWHRPCICLGSLVDVLNISPLVADVMLTASAVYLLVGSGLLLWQLPRNAGSELKISCPRCGGHIAFPAHGIGQSISCPHCNAPIVLQKP